MYLSQCQFMDTPKPLFGSYCTDTPNQGSVVPSIRRSFVRQDPTHSDRRTGCDAKTVAACDAKPKTSGSALRCSGDGTAERGVDRL